MAFLLTFLFVIWVIVSAFMQAEDNPKKNIVSGGLASLYVGSYAFAIWGVSIYITDTLVGIRAFPSSEKPIRWLTTQHILFLIIVIYYAAQYALVSWAL